ncbi:MAG: type II secretion system protein GspM [Pseudomonadota bacterium]
MTEFWRNLSERERLLISVGGALAALFLVLQFVVSPVANWRADSRQALASAKGLYEIVAEAAARSDGAGPSQSDVPALRNALTQTAGAADVTLVFVNIRPDGVVDATVATTQPQALFDWMAQLRKDYGARVVSADIAREAGEPSLVRGQLSFAQR